MREYYDVSPRPSLGLLFSLIYMTVVVEIGLTVCMGKDDLQVLLSEMGVVISKNRRAKNRVRLYWDVDNIELPNQNLDPVLQRLRQVHVTHLEWPAEEVVDFELKLVCNECTNGRIGEAVKRTVRRAGFSLTVVANDKEATDREIEGSIHNEILDYVEHKREGTKYNCFIGVLSNDEDFAATLRRAKERGVSTAYVSSSPQLQARENVKGATTCIIDCADLGINTSDASNDTTDIASPSRPPIVVVSPYPSPPVMRPYSPTSPDGPERGTQETPSAITTDSSPEAEKIASDVPSLLDPPPRAMPRLPSDDCGYLALRIISADGIPPPSTPREC